MIRAGYPEGIFPFHAVLADQHILYGIIEHMPHMQDPGNIGWGDYDGVGLPLIGFRVEIAMLHPVVVPTGFNALGIVFGRYIHVLVWFLKIRVGQKVGKDVKNGAIAPICPLNLYETKISNVTT
jgi:hypothetical protein